MKKTYFQTIKTLTLGVFSFFFMNSLVFAQSEYSFNFQQSKIEIPANIETVSLKTSDIPSSYKTDVYVWMQFKEIPLQENQNDLKNHGVELINYISNRTYLARFNENISKSFLINNGVRGISPLSNKMKINSELRDGNLNPWAIENNNAKLTVIVYDNVSMSEAISNLQLNGVQILNHYRGHHVLEVSLPIDKINTLGDFGFVKWVEEISSPAEKEDIGGRNLHRANGLDTQTPTGRNYTGEGIGVLVRDDGIVGPHIDFEGRMDNSSASGTGQTHGDGVAGILTGAGNLDPTKRGMAVGSNLYVANYGSNFLDAATTTRIANGTVQITNSSYGDGCNGGYTNNTVSVDNQVYNNPTILHVFSCGNSGTSNCGFGAGSGWGNITGGHKQGKNVIATANTLYDGVVVNSSSRGPAYDGRIKPDIAAHGNYQLSTDENNTYQTFSGTSGAAPGIAGISAQLYEAYQDANSGTLPPSALIKAILLNTASDAGNVGPDFKYGWGIVNGLRAGILIEDGRHLTSSITQGSNNNHTIAVPAGTKQVKFMLYWMDPAATNGAATALVNDLDLTVTDPSNNNYLPWILDPTPSGSVLNTPATTGADHLNNMEQVSIDNPTAGSYTVNIDGFAIPSGPQDYFIVYEIITDDVILTYPNKGESLIPGVTETIHWDAPISGGLFNLEYSVDNGSSWSTIATVSSFARNYDWIVPNNVTGSALVKITRGAVSDQSDSTFSIAPIVTGQSVTQVCPTTMTFSWNAVSGAENYDVYVLGTKYMEVVGNSTTTSYVHTITNPNAPVWYAIVAKNTTLGWNSRRTIASYYAGGSLNCTFPVDLFMVSIDNDPNEFSALCNPSGTYPVVTIKNEGATSATNFTISYQVTGQPIVTETYTGTLNVNQQIVHTFSTILVPTTTGNYTLTTSVNLSGDGNVNNDSKILSLVGQTTGISTPVAYDFENSSLVPVTWTIDNPDADVTWEQISVMGASGTQTQVAYMDNYSYNDQGQVDAIQTEQFFINGGGYAVFRFDLAKAQYSGTYSDELEVLISNDCNQTWTSIYTKSGTTLATVPYATSSWSPTLGSDWREETIDISAYIGQNVSFRIENTNDYSNGTYIDNINITSNLSLAENSGLEVGLYPNPTTTEFKLSIANFKQKEYAVQLLNSVGQIVKTIPATDFVNNSVNVNVTDFTEGVYFVKVQIGEYTIVKKLVKK